MHINTDTQKALEHLRELASNPSELERIQTLANNPNLIQEIKKIANQSFSDQLKTLPPFTPANLPQTTTFCNINDEYRQRKKKQTSVLKKSEVLLSPPPPLSIGLNAGTIFSFIMTD
jgi:hypothetical protein